MSDLFRTIRELVLREQVIISEHGYEQLLLRNIDFEEVIAGIRAAMLLEDYSASRGEPRVLVQQTESNGRPIHVVWELGREPGEYAVLVTAFRPGAR